MLAIFAGANSNTTGNVPVVTSVATALLTTGSCSAHPGVPSPAGTIRTTWSMANADSTGAYVTNIYKNSVFVVQIANNVVSRTENAPGVQGDPNHNSHVDWTFRIDVVRVSDSQVMNSATGNRYQDDFGDCNGPA
jgi:hypothetical protein